MDERRVATGWIEAGAMGCGLVALAVLGWSGDPTRYLLFHVLVELFVIIVAAATATVVWNSRDMIENGYLTVLAIAGLFVASIDLLHMLTYKGMGLLPVTGADIPTQLWLAGRYVQAASILGAAAFIGRRVRVRSVVLVFSAVTGLLLAAILWWHVFPDAYVEGTGLTAFKTGSEFAVMAALALGLVLLVVRREAFEREVMGYLGVFIGSMVAAEFAFTMYATVYARANLVGHLLRVVGAYALYRAIVVTAISRPYDLLFRELKQSEERLRRAKELSDALTDIDAAMSSSLDAETIMRAVVSRGADALGVDVIRLTFREGAEWVSRYSRRAGQDAEAGAHLSDDELPLSLLVERTQQPLVVQDVSAEVAIPGIEIVRASGIASYLGVPMLVKDEVIGVLTFARAGTPRPFTAEQVDFASRLAASLSLALENARMFAVEHRIADTLQEALLSPPPQMAGLELSHLYHSATEAARVGGDFYDVFEVGAQTVGIIVGDVSGKGLEAAALTAVAKTAVKANASIGGTPAEVLGRVNEFLYRHTGESAFVTVFYGTLDLRSGRLDYCSGGHPPAVLRRADGTATQLAATSPLVGAFAGVGFSDETETMSRGDVLVLYTDGVIECRGSDGLFGDERLLEVVSAWQGPSSGLPAEVLSAVQGFCGGVLADDIAVVAIART